jgi:UDP:flavonoid glycosyltransferase YjiC (YdhE family)
MPTIVIYSAGTLGDHLPFLALGETLRTRGYQVRLAVNPAMCSFVQRAGLEAVALPEPRLGGTEARGQAQNWDHWQEMHLPLLDVDGAIRRLRHLLALCRQADMLLATSLRPWGWLAQQALGLPGLTVSVMPAQFWQPRPRHIPVQSIDRRMRRSQRGASTIGVGCNESPRLSASSCRKPSNSDY